MKILISLLTLVFLVKDCKNNKQSQERSDYQKDLTITYVANTRGFYEHIKLTKDSISFSKDRNLKIVTTNAYPKKDWNELITLIKNIDIAATLELNSKEQDVRTPIFDHGNPPKTLAEVVKKVLALKDKVLQN